MKYLKYLSFAVGLILVFFAGRCTAPTEDKELKRKFELERKTLLDDVKLREARIIDRTNQDSIIIQKMKEDHARDSMALKANNEAYIKIVKEYGKINFRGASIAELDSARAKYITLYSRSRE